MNWKQAKNVKDNLYDIPGEWLKIEYFEALNILFRIENSLRVFVYVILKNEYQDKWKDLSIISDDAESSTISAIAKKRLAQEKKYAYLGFMLNSPLLHLTSGELIRIITSNAYWRLFKNYFPGSKDIIKNKLDEISNVRNSLAHFRPIKKGDVELVKLNSIHTLQEIENTLNDFINCPNIVPTNTNERWYKEIKDLNTEECEISFKQSKNEQWIKLILSFTAPVFKISNYFFGYLCTTVNLRTDSILIDYPQIIKHAICVTEVTPSAYTENPDEANLVKKIRFTFSRGSLEKNYAEIKTDLENILSSISEEIALIREDNLARGRLIEVIKGSFDLQDDKIHYYLDGQIFQTEFDEESSVEYWGSLNYSSKNFITDTDKYPWMPVEISKDYEFPF
ncbi:MAG: hypothetical protein WC098_02630 [Bacteroidales bacterium]|jgi:hypothetical protein